MLPNWNQSPDVVNCFFKFEITKRNIVTKNSLFIFYFFSFWWIFAQKENNIVGVGCMFDFLIF
jgi:hypothetical protein